MKDLRQLVSGVAGSGQAGNELACSGQAGSGQAGGGVASSGQKGCRHMNPSLIVCKQEASGLDAIRTRLRGGWSDWLRMNRMRKRLKITLSPGTCHYLGNIRVPHPEMSKMPQEVWIFIKNKNKKNSKKQQQTRHLMSLQRHSRKKASSLLLVRSFCYKG